ncbi:MAG: response regulator [Sedimentisphaerales bacterium]|nr:response regulator [Sedimentisphaerales bacterium]
MKNFTPILLVDDDDIDALSVRRAFKELNITNKLVRSVNGEEALKYLDDQCNEMPCMILLDLNMPKMNGIEFLSIIKEDDKLKCIPVIVLTTSTEECDVKESFKYSVGGYVVKPVDYKSFVEAIRTVNMYWSLSELPSQEERLTNAKCEINSIG